MDVLPDEFSPGQSSLDSHKPLRVKFEDWSKEERALLASLRAEGLNFYQCSLRLPAHSPEECKAFWQQHGFKPARDWTAKDISLLLSLCHGGTLSWNEIAGFFLDRTPLDCQSRYDLIAGGRARSDQVRKEEQQVSKPAKDWTAKDVSLLLSLCDQGTLSWDEIAAHFSDRTPLDCQSRYDLVAGGTVPPDRVRKEDRQGSKSAKDWTGTELSLLLSLHDRGTYTWDQIAATLPDRTPLDCQSRYNLILRGPIRPIRVRFEEQQAMKDTKAKNAGEGSEMKDRDKPPMGGFRVKVRNRQTGEYTDL